MPWLIVGLVVLSLIFLGTTGFLGYQNYKLKQEVSEIRTTPTSQPDGISPTPTIDLTYAPETPIQGQELVVFITTTIVDEAKLTGREEELLERTYFENAKPIVLDSLDEIEEKAGTAGEKEKMPERSDVEEIDTMVLETFENIDIN